MNYKIEEIEGVGPTYGSKLIASGVKTTQGLLRRCGDPKGRRKLAEETGLEERQLLKWANMADLMRINGVGKQFAELLEAAGVDTVKELKMRRPDNLAAKMAEVNGVKKLARVSPPEKKVADWIEQAKTLEPAISY